MERTIQVCSGCLDTAPVGSWFVAFEPDDCQVTVGWPAVSYAVLRSGRVIAGTLSGNQRNNGDIAHDLSRPFVPRFLSVRKTLGACGAVEANERAALRDLPGYFDVRIVETTNVRFSSSRFRPMSSCPASTIQLTPSSFSAGSVHESEAGDTIRTAIRTINRSMYA